MTKQRTKSSYTIIYGDHTAILVDEISNYIHRSAIFLDLLIRSTVTRSDFLLHSHWPVRNTSQAQSVDYQLEVDKGKLTAVANLKS